MSKRKPTVVSLFSGCGGSSLGYKMAGYRVLMGADIDPHAVETYEANFPETPVWAGDVTKLSLESIQEITGQSLEDLDVLDGSPPCQGFSTAKGERSVFDERNFLFVEFARILGELRPKAFVMENVSGMVKGNHRWVFAEIHRRLQAVGYHVVARMVSAQYLGVPQARRRVIFVGVRSDLGIAPAFPKPGKKVITVREALATLPEDLTEGLHDLGYQVWKRTVPGRTFTHVHPMGNVEKGKNFWFNGHRIHPDRPAPTVTAFVTPTGGGGGLFHWSVPRCLNIPELKRISSFPDDFKIEGRFALQWARIGNAVPPKMMKAIATTLKKEVLTA